MQSSQEVSQQSFPEGKVAVIPCAGMDKALGSVARACAFNIVENLRPDKTVLVCIPPLVAGVKPYSEIVKTHPSITIDGCLERCATKIAVKNGATIKGGIMIPESVEKHKLDLGPEREKLEEKLAKEIAMQRSQEASSPPLPVGKVAIIPCAGMDKALGSVARACAFKVVENLRPDKAVLICIPPLIAGVKPYSEMVKAYPSITIDGCVERCATKIAVRNGAKIRGRILIPESVQKHKLKPKSASDIGPDGEKLAEKLAEEIAAEIDRLVRK